MQAEQWCRRGRLSLQHFEPTPPTSPLQEAATYARETGMLFIETSAKTGENVEELFTLIGPCIQS